MEINIQLFALIGFLLSCYAVYVKWKSSQSISYKPICDIHKNISCTKALLSEYGTLVFLPNSYFGILFYVLVFLLSLFSYYQILFYFSAIAVLGSLYLAYISFVMQRNFCLVCTSIYIVNILLFIYSYRISY